MENGFALITNPASLEFAKRALGWHHAHLYRQAKEPSRGQSQKRENETQLEEMDASQASTSTGVGGTPGWVLGDLKTLTRVSPVPTPGTTKDPTLHSFVNRLRVASDSSDAGRSRVPLPER